MHSARYHRARVRETRLRELGYDTYDAYLRSAAWRDVRRRYFASGLPQICMCGEAKVHLHHTTYERVGRELLEDLIPLCRDCHTMAHDLEAAGIIDLDLKGFYYDPERAKDGQMYLAQLKAKCPSNEDLRADKRQAFEAWHAARDALRGRQRRVVKELVSTHDVLTNRALRHVGGASGRKIKHRRTLDAERVERQDRVARPIDLSLRRFTP